MCYYPYINSFVNCFLEMTGRQSWSCSSSSPGTRATSSVPSIDTCLTEPFLINHDTTFGVGEVVIE